MGFFVAERGSDHRATVFFEARENFFFWSKLFCIGLMHLNCTLLHSYHTATQLQNSLPFFFIFFSCKIFFRFFFIFFDFFRFFSFFRLNFVTENETTIFICFCDKDSNISCHCNSCLINSRSFVIVENWVKLHSKKMVQTRWNCIRRKWLGLGESAFTNISSD